MFIMNWKNKYIKYQVPMELIRSILARGRKNVVFFIDFLSISKGLYNKDNIFFELSYYIEKKQPSDVLIQEYWDFLNKLYKFFEMERK